MIEKSVHVSLDIGTSAVKVIVAEYVKNQLNVVGVGVEKTKGVNKGVIVDIDATAIAIKEAVKKAAQRSGLAIHQVIVGVPSNQVTIEECRGMIAVGSENREITNADVDSVISAAKVRSIPAEREIIAILPEEFVVDGFDGIRDPRGMIGVRLELYAHLITGPKTIIHNIRRAVEKAGLTISEFVLQPLATSQVALSKGESSFGTILIDMGAGQTVASAIHDEQVKFVYIDPQGGDYVTKDISEVLSMTIENSETIKREYGYAVAKDVEVGKYFLAEIIGHKDPIRVEEKYLSEIIEARIIQTFENVKKALDGVDALDLPGGIVLSGGGAMLPGVVELAEKIFKVPVRLYSPTAMGVRHPRYAQALGLLQYAVQLDDIHHFAQFDQKSYVSQKVKHTNERNIVVPSKPNRVEETQVDVSKRYKPSSEDTVEVKATKPVHKVNSSSKVANPKGVALLDKVKNSFKGFFDSLGEE